MSATSPKFTPAAGAPVGHGTHTAVPYRPPVPSRTSRLAVAATHADADRMPAIARTRATAAQLTDRFGTDPFRVTDAEAVGISRARLRAAQASGHLRLLRHGVLQIVRVGGPTSRSAAGPAGSAAEKARRAHLDDIRAAMASLRSPAVGSHASAAAVLGLPHPDLIPVPTWPVELTAPGRGGRAASWIRHQAAVGPSDLVTAAGLPVTSALRTAIDIARTRDPARALIVADRVLRDLLVTGGGAPGYRGAATPLRDPVAIASARARLESALAAANGRHGVVSARRVVEWSDPGAENALESYSRGRLLMAGLPRPTVGVPVRGDDGRLYFGDLGWEEYGVIAEADGRGKYTEPRVLYAEKKRQEVIERTGRLMVRWTWEEMAYTPLVVVTRVAGVLTRRGWRRGRSG